VSEALICAAVELLEENNLVLLATGNDGGFEFGSGAMVLAEEVVEVTRVAPVEVGVDTPGATRPGVGTLLLEGEIDSAGWVMETT